MMRLSSSPPDRANPQLTIASTDYCLGDDETVPFKECWVSALPPLWAANPQIQGLRGWFIAACAAAIRAIGMRNGEQDT